MLHVLAQKGHHQAYIFYIFNIKPDGCFGPNTSCDVNKTLFYSKLQLCLAVFFTSYLYNIKGHHSSSSTVKGFDSWVTELVKELPKVSSKMGDRG